LTAGWELGRWGVGTQIRDSVAGLSDDQLLHTLRSHFRGSQQSIALSHAQHLRRFLRPGGCGLDHPHALAQVLTSPSPTELAG
jgi:hypothetical protein